MAKAKTKQTKRLSKRQLRAENREIKKVMRSYAQDTPNKLKNGLLEYLPNTKNLKPIELVKYLVKNIGHDYDDLWKVLKRSIELKQSGILDCLKCFAGNEDHCAACFNTTKRYLRYILSKKEEKG